MSKILVLGEVMLDYYTYGVVERINPEAPVPVIEVKREEYTLGGAGNVAKNLVGLKENPILVSICNHDEAGIKIRELARNLGIDTYFINDSRPTIVKHRFIALGYNQQLLRVDKEERTPLSREHADRILEKISEINPEIIVISDYGKGLITPYLMDKLKQIYKGKILVDPKPKNIKNYRNVYLIKPNMKEARMILGEEIINENQEVGRAARKIMEKYSANIVITRGDKGATLATLKGEIYHLKAKARQVHDVSGAGDTFIATLTYAIKNGYSLKQAVELANKAASIVVGKLGTVAITREELEENEDILSEE